MAVSLHGLTFSELQGADASANALLARHHALMRAQSPAESCHVLTAAELQGQGARLFVGRDEDGTVRAIGGLVAFNGGGMPQGAAELKSMHCHADLRGRGAGAALLVHMLAQARQAGLTTLWLETGSAIAFQPARRLYATHGFAICPPFGHYTHDPLSVYMMRRL